MNILRSVLLFACLAIVTNTSLAQTSLDRTWFLMSEPSDERMLFRAENEVRRGWVCFNIRTGRLRTDCPVTMELKGIGGPGVTVTCTPDAITGRIAPQTCGNGGHTHDETNRPIVFPNTQLRYPGGINNGPLSVSGPSPGDFNTLFEWTVSIVSGIYTFTSTMTAPTNSSFWALNQGVLTKVQTVTAEGRLNVTVDGDTLAQLPDSSPFFDKARKPNATAMTHRDSVAFAATLTTRIALAAIGRVFEDRNNKKISYNDASLPKGGLFDLNAVHPSGGTDRPWQTPHSQHRDGLDVDVNWPDTLGCSQNSAIQNTSVKAAVDTVLNLDPGPLNTGNSALLCEASNNDNYHINITSLKIPQAFLVLFAP